MFKKRSKALGKYKENNSWWGMLYSKEQKIFYPNLAIILQKAKGCYIWTLENKKLLDLSLMGCGTNTLGYSVKKLIIQ